jgi:structural maintenance of chromosome 2
LNYVSNRIKHIQEISQLLKEEISEIENRSSEVLEEKGRNGGAFLEIEERIKDLGKELTKIKSQISHKVSSRKDETELLDTILMSSKEICMSIEAAMRQFTELEQTCSSTIKENLTIRERVADTENLIQTLTTGLTSAEGQENGYIDKLNSTLLLNRLQAGSSYCWI